MRYLRLRLRYKQNLYNLYQRSVTLAHNASSSELGLKYWQDPNAPCLWESSALPREHQAFVGVCHLHRSLLKPNPIELCALRIQSALL